MKSKILNVDLYPESDFYIERRDEADRRTSIAESHRYNWLGGKRKIGRRNGEQHNLLVDVHNPWHMFVVMGIMMLSVTDAILTLKILSSGGVEVNLFLDWVVQNNIELFASVKFALTGLSIIFLTRYINYRLFNLFSVSTFLQVVFAGYIVLISYQIALLQLI